MKEIEIDGKKYTAVPTERIEDLKETVAQILMYPHANKMDKPLGIIILMMRDFLREDWPTYWLETYARMLESTSDKINPELEPSERPYALAEYLYNLRKLMPYDIYQEFIEAKQL